MLKDMKCDECKRKATYICDAYLLSGKVELRGCDKHWPIAYARQQQVLMKERFEQRARMIDWQQRMFGSFEIS